MASIVQSTSPVLSNNSSVAFTEKSTDVNSLLMSNAIYDRYDMDWL